MAWITTTRANQIADARGDVPFKDAGTNQKKKALEMASDRLNLVPFKNERHFNADGSMANTGHFQYGRFVDGFSVNANGQTIPTQRIPIPLESAVYDLAAFYFENPNVELNQVDVDSEIPVLLRDIPSHVVLGIWPYMDDSIKSPDYRPDTLTPEQQAEQNLRREATSLVYISGG